jgi:succinoglycan biosynthesis transport protein ExoP
MYSIDPRATINAASTAPPEPAASSMGPRELLGVLWRRRRWIGVSTAGLVFAAVVFLIAVPSRYTSTTQLLIDPSGLQVVDKEVTPSSQTADVAAAVVETQIRLLTSDTVLRRVVERERLDRDPEFNRAAPALLGIIKSAVRAMVGHPRERDPELEALRTLQERVKAVRPQASFVVDLGVSTRDPDKSARLARAVSEAFIEAQNALRREAARRASEALASRLQELQDRVKEAENAVERFKVGNNIVGASGRLVNEQQLTELTNALGAARARTSELRARYEQIERLRRTGVAPDAIPETIQSPAIAQLRGQYAEVKRLEDNLFANLGALHPDLGSIRAQSRSLRQQIADEVARVGSAAKSDFERAKANEEALAKNLEGLKDQSGSVNHLLIRLRELEREAQASRAVYESFLNRTRELKEQQDVDTSNTAVITPALPPAKPSGLSPVLLLFVAGAIGMSLGAISAVAREQIDGRIHTGRQFTVLTRLPVLAALPRPRGEDWSGVLPLLLESAQPVEVDWSGRAKPRSRSGVQTVATRALFRLHDALRDTNASRPPRVVLVTAIEDDLGRSMVSLNLALAAATRGERVLLVDASSTGVLTAAFGLRVGVFLADVLEGQAAFDAAFIRDARNLAVLAGTPAGLDHPSEEQVQNRLVDPARSFDLILIDGGLVGMDPNLRAFAEAANDILLVVQAGVTRIDRLDEARGVLGSHVAKVLGAIVTEPTRRFEAPAFALLPIEAPPANTVAASTPSEPANAESRRRSRVPEGQVLPIGRCAASG